MELATLAFAALISFSMLSTNIGKKKTEENIVGTLDEVTAFFETNISSMRLAYKEEFQKDWNVNKIENVAYLFEKEAKEQLGYVVEFDEGYISYSLEMSIYAFNTEDALEVTLNEYYLDDNYIGYFNDDVFFPLIETNKPQNSDMKCVGSDDSPMADISKVTTFNQFEVNNCLSPISYLQQHYPNVQYGDYLPLCTEQGQHNTCAPRALTNLFCGYKASGYADFMMGFNVEEIFEWIRDEMKCDENHGTYDTDIKPAMDDCVALGSGGTWWVLAGQNDNSPSLETFYKIGWGGHAVVGIGNGQSVYWWIFKTYWRIVVSWDLNFKESSFEWGRTDRSIYVIDAQYETHSWTILPK